MDMFSQKTKKTGYYLSAKPIDGKRALLHRRVWIKHNGEIPKSANVHHIDENKENNDISNLMLMVPSKHSSMHTNKRISSDYENYKQKFLDRTQEKAKEWHRSSDGRQWHSNHAKNSLLKAAEKTEEKICVVCGARYMAAKSRAGKAIFCSKKCKAKYRRDMHLDYVAKKCVVCGKEFSSDKYGDAKTCGKECKVRLFKKSRCGEDW